MASPEFFAEQAVRVEQMCMTTDGCVDDEALAVLASFLRQRQRVESVQLASQVRFEGKGARREMIFVPQSVKLHFLCDAIASLEFHAPAQEASSVDNTLPTEHGSGVNLSSTRCWMPSRSPASWS